MPAELTVGEIREAGRGSPPAEAQALAALTANLPGTLPIPLTGYVARTLREMPPDASVRRDCERSGHQIVVRDRHQRTASPRKP
ncbi:MAG TPA: hypothetical protein VFG91_10865 [Woeseiaceae bacterium]|nr:hypothetical protein [Woeseiaceae bacterium]